MKTLNVEPIALTGSVANLLNPNVSSLAGPVGFTMTQPYILIGKIRLTNTTGLAVAVFLYKGGTGASAAGSELGFSGTLVPANSSLDYSCNVRLDAADFLTGKGLGVTINIDADIGLSG